MQEIPTNDEGDDLDDFDNGDWMANKNGPN